MDRKIAESLIEAAETGRTGLTGLESQAALAGLEQRYPEFLDAMQWFVDAGRADDALRISGALVPFWMATKRLAEGDAWFERLLAVPVGDAARRGRALFDHGYLIFWAGADERSAALQREALELGRETNEPTTMALALGGLARIALRTDLDEATRLLREAIAVTDGTTDRLGRSGAMHVLGVVAQMSGDLEEARRLMTERIALARETGNFATIASESGNLSMVERQLGNLAEAEALAREALDIVSRRHDELQTAWMVNALAAVTAAQGREDRAATLVGLADGAMERAGGEWPPDERIQYDGTVATLSERMGAEQFERGRAKGYAMTTPEGVAFALGPASAASARA